MRAYVLVGLALLGMVATTVWAQGIPASSPVQVTTPDGGLPVTVGNQRVAVEATGPAGDPVAVSGTVGLTQSSMNSLTAPCSTISAAPPVITLTTTAVDVPTTPLTNRTQLIVKNLSNNHIVWCCVGAACTPTSTAAYVILTGGDHQDFPVRASTIVRCKSASGTADVNAQEAICG